VHSGLIWVTTGTSGWPCEYHNEHVGYITLGEIVAHLNSYQLVKMHLLKYTHQNILKIVILRLVLIYYAYKDLCVPFSVQNLIRFHFCVKFIYCAVRRKRQNRNI